MALEIPGFSGYGNTYYLDIFRSSLPRTIWLYAMYFGDQVRVTPGPVNLARPVIDNTSASSVFGGYHIGGSVYFARIVDSKAYTTNAELMKRLEQEDRRERYEQFLKKEKEEFLNRTLKEQQKADEENEYEDEETEQNDTQPTTPKEQVPPPKTETNTQKTNVNAQETNASRQETAPNAPTNLPQRN